MSGKAIRCIHSRANASGSWSYASATKTPGRRVAYVLGMSSYASSFNKQAFRFLVPSDLSGPIFLFVGNLVCQADPFYPSALIRKRERQKGLPMGEKKGVTREEERWGILPRSQESIPSLLSSRWICLGAYAGAKGRRFPPCLCRRSRPQFPALEQRFHSKRGQVLSRLQIQSLRNSLGC
jgi:hypothetical protein